MFRLVLAALALLAIAAVPVSAQTYGDIRLPPEQDAAAMRLARRLVDGDISRQVFTADYTARLCYRAAVSNTSNAAGSRDRNGLAPPQQAQFTDCVGQSGYRMRGD
ncbi:hypothetical protein ACJ4V0_18580 [Phreatobacter sp. HK31-P]